MGLKNPIVEMKSIDWDHVRQNDCFTGLEQACKDRGVFGLTTFRKDWCDEAIMQFYSTLFVEEETMTMHWMTNGKKFKATYDQFMRVLGLATQHDEREQVKKRIHEAGEPLKSYELLPFYVEGAAAHQDFKAGQLKFMHPSLVTLCRVLWHTLIPK